MKYYTKLFGMSVIVNMPDDLPLSVAQAIYRSLNYPEYLPSGFAHFKIRDSWHWEDNVEFVERDQVSSRHGPAEENLMSDGISLSTGMSTGMSTGRGYYKDYRRWGIDEDKLLRSTYSKGGVAASKRILPHKTRSSIIARAKRLGLSRSGTGKIKYWTGLDEIKLKRLWRNSDKEKILEALPGRSWKAITSRANKLDLFRSTHVRYPFPKTDNVILDKIRIRMKERGFTATDLQVISSLGRNSLRVWFKNDSQPKLKSIEKAVEALDGELVIKWR